MVIAKRSLESEACDSKRAVQDGREPAPSLRVSCADGVRSFHKSAGGLVSYHLIFKLAKIKDAHKTAEDPSEGEREHMGGVATLQLREGQDPWRASGHAAQALR